MMIHTECALCQEKATAIVHHEDLRTWQTTTIPMQRVFPYLTPDVRELFFGIGWCSDCWDREMGFDGEDD